MNTNVQEEIIMGGATQARWMVWRYIKCNGMARNDFGNIHHKNMQFRDI